MGLSCGFFNSLNHDRKYLASDMSKLFDGIIRDGVFASIGTCFIVQADTGLTVKVGTGRAWFNHTWTYNDTLLPVTASSSNVLLNRIDALVIEVNSNDEVRNNTIKFIEGTPATTPVRPTLVHANNVNQYPLCYILRKANINVIKQEDINNTVGSAECPFVTGILQVIDIDSLIPQWRDQLTNFTIDQEHIFEEWMTSEIVTYNLWRDELDQYTVDQKADFNNWRTSEQALYADWLDKLKDQLSENVAGNLQLQINEINEGGVTRFQVAGGTSNAITVDIGFIDYNSVTFIIKDNNNGSATTINGKPLYKPNSTSAPTLTSGKPATVWYSATGDCFFIKASGEGTALVGDVLAGKTFTNDDGTAVGTIPVVAADLSDSILASSATIHTGYPGGDRWAMLKIPANTFIRGANWVRFKQPNIIPDNIKSGVDILGTVGTLSSGAFNVYTGDTAPTEFEGVWIQTSQPLINIVDGEIWFANAWNDPSLMSCADIPYNAYLHSAVAIDTDIYVMGGDLSQTLNYKYDTLTNSWIKMVNIPYNAYYHSAVVVGTDVYVMGGRSSHTLNYKYDTLTNSWTQMVNIPYNAYYHSAVAIGTDVYVMGGYDSIDNYKYDTLTNSWTQMVNIPYYAAYHSAVAIGTDVYVMGGGRSLRLNYKYDTLTNSWIKMQDIPYDASAHSAVAVGTDVYVMGGYNSIDNYKYDTLTNSWIKMVNIPYDASHHSAVYTNNAIHVMGGSTTRLNNIRYNLTDKPYPTGTAYIRRDSLSSGAYQTELCSTGFSGNNRFLISFDDVYFYLSDTLQTNLPTYYGTGTGWTKFKG